MASVRKAYLSTVEPPPLSRRPKEPERNVSGDAKVEEEWARWEKVKYLTDKERDEIDLRARMILRRCQERIGILEVTEQSESTLLSLLSIQLTWIRAQIKGHFLGEANFNIFIPTSLSRVLIYIKLRAYFICSPRLHSLDSERIPRPAHRGGQRPPDRTSQAS